MLKNKKTLYVTLPLAFGIWGYIAYKVYDGLRGEEIALNPGVSELPLAAMKQETDTFSLFNNYEDPFLRGSKTTALSGSTQSSHKHSQTKPMPHKTVAPPANTDWPPVVYSGLIKNQSNSTELILLSISGKLHTLRQGEVAEGLKVVSFNNSELVLAKGKDKKTFTR